MARGKPVVVLAVQGAFERHARMLRSLGHEVRLARRADDLADAAGLVLPGGESTVQLDLIARFDLEGPIRSLVSAGVPVLATCAGLILAAERVLGPQQRSFGVLDVTVTRNGWGRQLDSFEAMSDAGRSLVLIRAPRITSVGPRAQVVDRLAGEPILVRQGAVWGATFHPELTDDASLPAKVFGASAHLASTTPRSRKARSTRTT